MPRVEHDGRQSDHPVCAASEASQHFLDGAATPPQEEGNISHLTSHISHLTSHISHLTSHISYLTSLISHFLEVLNNIGTVEYARQRYDNALQQYEKALKIRPESPTVLLNMGACLLDMKRYEEGLKATQHAIEIDPKILDRTSGFGTLIQTSRRSDPMVSFYFAKIYAGQGDKERAISYLNRALDEGFKDFDKIKSEKAFATLAADEGYLKLLDRIAALSASNTPDQ